MTKQEAFDEINKLQDYYVDELISLINNPDYSAMKAIDFTSPTGTGKTKMMSKLINKLKDCYFIVTTLSKGQLHLQVRESLSKDCDNGNFYVYGSADYRINSKLDAETIIGRIPTGKKCIWLRDEGHIKTNRYDFLLQNVCYKVINFSATNPHSDIQCNFTQTMMLRTVNQTNGTPEDAIQKLLEVKEAHKAVKGYNPCAIFRCVGGDTVLYDRIIRLCKENNLKYIDITENSFNMAELCKDDNEYDVIINKFKIVEGIDIRRAHVLYMDNQPANNATTIQVIGRCRRNALLYRNDIDIMSPENSALLAATRECYVYYNVQNMKIDSDSDGELYYAFCDIISCESLKAGMTVHVENGVLPNGLTIIELEDKTGDFLINTDPNTGYNIVSPITDFYETIIRKFVPYLYIQDFDLKSHPAISYKRISLNDVPSLYLHKTKSRFDYGENNIQNIPCNPYYCISIHDMIDNYQTNNIVISQDNLKLFSRYMNKYDKSYIIAKLPEDIRIESIISNSYNLNKKFYSVKYLTEQIEKTVQKNSIVKEAFVEITSQIKQYEIEDITDTSYNLKHVSDIFNNEAGMTYLKYCCIKMFEKKSKYDPDLKYAVKIAMDRIKFISDLVIRLGVNEEDFKIQDKIIYYVFNEKIRDYSCYRTKDELLSYVRQRLQLSTNISIGQKVKIDESQIKTFFTKVDECITPSYDDYTTIGLSEDDISDALIHCITQTYNNLKQNIVDQVRIDYKALFADVSDSEKQAIEQGNIEITDRTITETELKRRIAYGHDVIINDKESAVIGTDMMHPIKVNNSMIWTEARGITSKAGSYNKLNGFISKQYAEELCEGKKQCFTGKNNFKLDKKCNSVLGYCVEYYSKYVVYGEDYLYPYIDRAKKESKTDTINPSIIVRACMLKYRAMMIRSFGKAMSKIIKSMSITALLQAKYQYFVSLVVSLGTQTAKYVMNTLYVDRHALDNVDPDLSIRHICGLADYITTDTILDIKVRNNIDEKCVRQVLGYHYLSTKRSDLNIKRVIVYDAVSNRSVDIKITDKNICNKSDK